MMRGETIYQDSGNTFTSDQPPAPPSSKWIMTAILRNKVLEIILVLTSLCSAQYVDHGAYTDAPVLNNFQSEIGGRVIFLNSIYPFYALEYRLGLFNNAEINLRTHFLKHYLDSDSELSSTTIDYSYQVGIRYLLLMKLPCSVGLSYSNLGYEYVDEGPVANTNYRNFETVGARLTVGQREYLTINTALWYKETNSSYINNDISKYFHHLSIGMGYYRSNRVSPELGLIFYSDRNSPFWYYFGIGYNFSF